MDTQAIDALLNKINASATHEGNARTKQVVNRIIRDLFITIEELDVTPNEFWSALNYLGEAGQSGELGLLAAGLGFEHFLDVRLDEAEAKVRCMWRARRNRQGTRDSTTATSRARRS
jgi:catechol 1,2-dioxygenase